MSARLVARRYAKAFVEIALAQGQLQQMQGELSRFTEVVREHADLRRVVENPLFAPKVKARAFEAVLGQMGASPTLRNFFRVVAEGARMGIIFEIEAAVRELVWVA